MGGGIELRDYQDTTLRKVRVSLRKHRRVLLQLPTGGGKTILAAKMAENSALKGKRIWFMCHRDFLILQTSQSFTAVGVDHAFIAAGWGYQPFMPVQVCSVATVARRLDALEGMKPDIMVWDECHHLAAGTWAKIQEWAGPTCYHVGLSATPCRLDGRGLDSAFDDMVLGPTPGWLIEHGYLSPYKVFAPGAPDLTGLHSRYGDYVKAEAEELVDKGAIIGDVVRHYNELSPGRLAIYFAVSVKHSKRIAEAFNAAGVPAMHLDADTPSHEREKAAIAMARRELQVITNVDLCGEGYDLSAQAKMPVTIETVGLCRPTKSLALHKQQMGRVLRPKADGSAGIILDHVGGTTEPSLGLPDADVEWSLSGAAKVSDGGGDSVPTRQCPKCFHVHRPTPVCPECGHVYEAKGRAVEEIDGTLREVDPSLIRHTMLVEENLCKTEAEFYNLAIRRGYHSPRAWARRKQQERQLRRTRGGGYSFAGASNPDPV